MKKVRNLCLYLLPLLSPFLVSALPTSDYYLTSSIYGPFSPYAENQELLFIVRSNSLISQDVYGQINIFNAHSVIISKSQTRTASISKFNSQTLQMRLMTNYYLSTSGMKAVFTLVDANTFNELVTSYFSLYPMEESTINPTEYGESSLEFKPTCLAFNNSGIVTYQEKYQFKNFYDYFLIDTYYRLLIDQFVLSYQFLQDLTYQTAILKFPKNEQLFPYLNLDENNDITIPLRLVKEDKSYHLCFSQTMYVNPITLQMASYPLANFVATSYFYLPKNGIKQLQNKDFNFLITGLGQNHSTFIWSSSLLVENNLLGPCFDSDYCVIGGITK